jgi:hypothetical protein
LLICLKINNSPQTGFEKTQVARKQDRALAPFLRPRLSVRESARDHGR